MEFAAAFAARRGSHLRLILRAMRFAYLHVHRILRFLREREYRIPALTPWTILPEIRLPNVGLHTYDTSAPRPELVRHAWDELDKDIANRLGIEPGEDEMEALNGLSNLKIRTAGLFKPFRLRVALGLMLLTGGRKSAIWRLDQSDFVEDHIGPPPDHRRGSVILLHRARHNMRISSARSQGYPDFARAIRVQRQYLERAREALYKRPGNGPRPDSPTLPDDFPLLVGNRLTLNRWSIDSLTNAFSGQVPSGEATGIEPLIMRERGVSPAVPSEWRKYIGYEPKAFRHLAEQLAERVGEIHKNTEHPASGGQPVPEPTVYASALMDHKHKGDPLKALYGDRNTEHFREVIAARTIEGIWRLITDGGWKP